MGYMLIALIVTGLLLLAIILICFYFSSLVIHPKTMTYEHTYNMEVEAGRINKEAFENLPKEDITIQSPYGYVLKGWYFPVQGANKTIIICHGITYTVYGSVKYMDLFMKRGFNILLYDHRNHGRSGGSNTTFGYYEKVDLKAWTDWVFDRHGPDHIVGIMGESMGAAIALQNAAIDPRVAFYIADCPYSDLYQQLKHRLKVEYHLPPFPLLNIVDYLIKLRTGMKYRDVSPIRDIESVKMPIFWIHGEIDDYVPTWMSIEMYNRKKQGVKKLYIAPNAAHAEAYWKNRKEYDKQIGEFLKEAHVI